MMHEIKGADGPFSFSVPGATAYTVVLTKGVEVIDAECLPCIIEALDHGAKTVTVRLATITQGGEALDDHDERAFVTAHIVQFYPVPLLEREKQAKAMMNAGANVTPLRRQR